MSNNIINLRKLRKYKNVKLEHLANRLQMSKSNLSLIENNKRRLSVCDLEKALDFLGYEIVIREKGYLDIDNEGKIEMNNIIIKDLEKELKEEYIYLIDFIKEQNSKGLLDEQFCKSLLYLTRNDKDTCYILNDIIFRFPESINDLEELIKYGDSKIYNAGIDRICERFNISEDELSDDIGYEKRYELLNGKTVSVIYFFFNYEAVCFIDEKEYNKGITLLELSEEKEAININEDLMSLFNENDREDLKNTLELVFNEGYLINCQLNVCLEIVNILKPQYM